MTQIQKMMMMMKVGNRSNNKVKNKTMSKLKRKDRIKKIKINPNKTDYNIFSVHLGVIGISYDSLQTQGGLDSHPIESCWKCGLVWFGMVFRLKLRPFPEVGSLLYRPELI